MLRKRKSRANPVAQLFSLFYGCNCRAVRVRRPNVIVNQFKVNENLIIDLLQTNNRPVRSRCDSRDARASIRATMLIDGHLAAANPAPVSVWRRSIRASSGPSNANEQIKLIFTIAFSFAVVSFSIAITVYEALKHTSYTAQSSIRSAMRAHAVVSFRCRFRFRVRALLGDK